MAVSRIIIEFRVQNSGNAQSSRVQCFSDLQSVFKSQDV